MLPTNWEEFYGVLYGKAGCMTIPPEIQKRSKVHQFADVVCVFFSWVFLFCILVKVTHRYAQIRTFARSLCFLARNGPSFPRTPTKSAKGCCRKLLWNEPWSKFCVVRVADGHTYCTIHPCKAIRTADETCGKTVEKLRYILCHHGRTLGSAGKVATSW
jgi:hypothetical protein